MMLKQFFSYYQKITPPLSPPFQLFFTNHTLAAKLDGNTLPEKRIANILSHPEFFFQ